MRQRIAIFITCIGLTVLSASCTYTAKLDPTTLRAPTTGQRILPLKVGVFIAPEVASHVDKTDVRTGVWSQHVTVDSGPKIARALELVARSNFQEVTTVSQTQPLAQQELLEFGFEGVPSLTCAWNAGFIMVGAQCTYTLPLKAKLVTTEGKVRWTDTVVVTGHSNSEQPLGNLPDASDFYPAVDDAINRLLPELNTRFANIPQT